jgi:hypothetical protein
MSAFLWCLIVGLIIRNAAGVIGPHLHASLANKMG